MNEKFTEFDKRITSIEWSAGGARHFSLGSSQGGWGPTPTSLKAVIHGFKKRSKRKRCEITCHKGDKRNKNKEKHFVDYPAVPITHVFVEFRETRIRDRFVRSVNMRKYELDERTVKISRALTAEERFDKKRLGYVKYAINKRTGIQLHCIQMNLETRSITVYGQLAARIESNGSSQYYKHGDVEGEVQDLMDKWLTKNL